jgi:hypothetical protein
MATETETAPATTQEAPAASVSPAPAPTTPAEKKSAKSKDAKQDAKGKSAEKGGSGKSAEKGGKGGKGAKKDAEDNGAESDADGPSVAAHPRAARGVARAKSWGGLAGFLLGGYLSLPTNTLAAAGLRALLAGVVCYVVVWAGAVFVWRRLVMLELKGREHQLLAAAHAAGTRRELPAASAERPGARAA